MHAIPTQVPCVLPSQNWTKDMRLSLLVSLDAFEIRRFSSTSVLRILCEIDSSISCYKKSLLYELYNTINTYWYIGDSIYKNISRMHILKMQTFSNIVDPLPVLIVLETL